MSTDFALVPPLRSIHPPALRSEAVARVNQEWKADVVKQVIDAIAKHDVVVVGMAWNQPVRHAKVALDAASVPYHYLEFGNYVVGWKERLAIKLWTGWPTFPQVFVKGVFIGGRDLTRAELENGKLRERLAAPRSWPA